MISAMQSPRFVFGADDMDLNDINDMQNRHERLTVSIVPGVISYMNHSIEVCHRKRSEKLCFIYT